MPLTRQQDVPDREPASPLPTDLLLLLPYLVTIVAVAGLVGRVRPPAAEGTPYVKGQA